MREFTYEVDGKTVVITARNRQTADRRFRAYVRGEMTLDGETIKKADRRFARLGNPDE